MRVRTGLIAVLSLLIPGGATIADGLLTLEATTPDPHIVGYTIAFQVTWAGPQPSSFAWDWCCTAGGSTSSWSAQQTTYQPSVGYPDVYVGSYDQRCTAPFWAFVFPPGMYSQYYSTITRSFTTVGPDSDVLTQGNGASSTGFPDMEVLTKWQIGYQGQAIGPYASVAIAERISTDNVNWSNWSTVTGPLFWYNGSTAEINDQKGIDVSDPSNRATWDAAPNGAIAWDLYQQNRATISDCHGNPVVTVLTTHHHQAIKDSATSFKFVLIY